MRRLWAFQLDPDSFMQIATMQGFKNYTVHSNWKILKSQMRFFNQFDPQLLYYIEKKFFLDTNGNLRPDATPDSLVKILQMYSFNSQQDDMKWIYPEFFKKLYQTMSHKDILEKLDSWQIKTVVQQSGRLKFTCEHLRPIFEKALNQLEKKWMTETEVHKMLILTAISESLLQLRLDEDLTEFGGSKVIFTPDMADKFAKALRK